MKMRFFSLFVISVLLFMFCACEKEPNIIYPNTILGKWRWIETMKVIPFSDTNPETPKNTGIEELLVFNENFTWYKTENTTLVDSGTFSLGHGFYITPSDVKFEYDSICYYQKNIPLKNGFDFYEIHHDTLVFCSYFGARWDSYTLSHAGTKRWVRQK